MPPKIMQINYIFVIIFGWETFNYQYCNYYNILDDMKYKINIYLFWSILFNFLVNYQSAKTGLL